MQTTLQLAAWGGSTALRIPKPFLQRLGIGEKSSVTVRITDNNELVITPAYRHKTLAERFKDYKGDYKGEIIDWGGDVGSEICD